MSQVHDSDGVHLASATRPSIHCAGMQGESDKRPGLLLVVSGPSGVGKTTIVRPLEQRLGGVFSVSATTRAPTKGETDGRDYYFLSQEEFQDRLEGGEFLEHAQLFGRHWYATPRGPVLEHLDAGQLVILDIDVQGGLQVKQAMPEAFMIFVLPPSDEELLRRLRARGRESEEVIQRRFAEAKREIERATSSGAYDATVVNDDLQQAIEATCRIVEEQLK